MNHHLYDTGELTKAMNASAFIQLPEAKVKTLLSDSRKLSDVEDGLFFAIKDRRDGHAYIADAFAAGVKSFVISEESFDRLQFRGTNFYLVPDTLKALQDLTAYHRSKFGFPVIGITGSNGKTVVKEWLYQLLVPESAIVRSPKSYNSQLGVPLSVWQMTDEHDLGIFEAGVSRSGEMGALYSVIRPTIGILTNIGEAHQEGFESRDEKIREKLSLFEGVDLFIYSEKYLEEYEGEIPGKQKFTWGYQEGAVLRVFDEEVLDEKFQFLRASFKGRDIQAVLPFTDQASIENGIICWAVMLALGYLPEEADKRLEKLHPVGMRLEMKNGIGNCSVIDDSYSLDLSSLAIALDFLMQQQQHSRRTIILSDIPGISSVAVYGQVTSMLEARGVDRLIGVGTEIGRYCRDISLDTLFFDNTAELIEKLPDLHFSGETILLKGARSFGFERISRLLTQKVHETVLEINLSALEHNLNYYKSLIPPGTKVMAMVKAFSYGSGSFEIANLLSHNKVDYLAVAYADEGVALRKSGTTLPIMVMSPDTMAFDTMIDHRLEPEIYSDRILKEFSQALIRKNQTNYPVHIKLDTGMHRLGFMEGEVEGMLDFVKVHPELRMQSVFSHFAAAEDPAYDDFTRQQIDLFIVLSEKIISNFSYPIIRHICNTSAVIRWPGASFEMVRLGIGLYGIDMAGHARKALLPVTSLKTTISQIKLIPSGDTIGYGREGKMPEGGKIATVKIGYADGYPRSLGNGRGSMYIRGEKVRTIGKICMDMCMLDITGLNAAEGDEVIVFEDRAGIEELAGQMQTSPYEVLTNISQRVKRIYYYE